MPVWSGEGWDLCECQVGAVRVRGWCECQFGVVRVRGWCECQFGVVRGWDWCECQFGEVMGSGETGRDRKLKHALI